MRPRLKRVYIVAAILVAGASAASQKTALDRYVAAPDSNRERFPPYLNRPRISGDASHRSKRGNLPGFGAKPLAGWTAFFIELTYPSGGKYQFKFTTAVRIVPDGCRFHSESSRLHVCLGR
jgi:hypothetical protein